MTRGSKGRRSSHDYFKSENDPEEGDSIITKLLYKRKKSESITQHLDRYTKLLDSITPTETPPPRNNASLTLINNYELFLFGGEYFNSKNVHIYNDSYIFNLNTNKWSLIKCFNKPKPRCSHQIVKYNDVLYMFGGEFATKDEYLHYNDLWIFSIKDKKWSEIKTTGNIPSGRSGHKMGIWNDNIILFGGFYDTNHECRYHNDIYIYNIKTRIWSKLESVTPGPSPRSASIFSIKDDMLFIYGGYSKINDVGMAHSDCWTIDLKRLSLDGNRIVWERRKLSGQPPRAEICYGNCVSDGIIYIFGGVRDINNDMDSIFYNDLLTIDPKNGKWMSLYNSEPRSLESLKLDKSKNFPIERANSLVAYINNVLYIYGGIREFKKGDVTLSDMWKYENNNWTCLIQCDMHFNQMESDSGSSISGSISNRSSISSGCSIHSGSSSIYTSSSINSKSSINSSVSSIESSSSVIAMDTDINIDCNQDIRVDYNNRMCEDIYRENEIIKVKKGEKLRFFFERTKEHWLQKVPSENVTKKEAKKLAFEICKNFYEN